jgi:hypothetical protein
MTEPTRPNSHKAGSLDLTRYAGTYGGYTRQSSRPRGFVGGFLDGLALGPLWRMLARLKSTKGQTMTAPDLGPLPEPEQESTYYCNKCGYYGSVGESHATPSGVFCDYNAVRYGPYYTADQMRAYALQERAKERERCAKLCEQEICACCWDDDAQAAAEHLAAEIRK